MRPTIEYCHSNATDELEQILESIEGDIAARRCLEHCGICRCEPFAVVDGTLLRGRALRSRTADWKGVTPE